MILPPWWTYIILADKKSLVILQTDRHYYNIQIDQQKHSKININIQIDQQKQKP